MYDISEQHKKARLHKPYWLKHKIHSGATCQKVKNLIQDLKLNTVCEEARCPNAGECFSLGTATFLILGNLCTRTCGFCAIEHGPANLPNPDEPYNIARAVQCLGLKYIVITSVTRDDLYDGGASHFARTIGEIRKRTPHVRIEILVPDFQGSSKAINTITKSRPDVINHNIETVPRLYTFARPESNYYRSLSLLETIHKTTPGIITKSGMMLGLGESVGEVRETMRDLLDVKCYVLNLGQYLQPSEKHLPVKRFVTPERFNQWKNEALKMGFKSVTSGPFVRSSYNAGELFIHSSPAFSGMF